MIRSSFHVPAAELVRRCGNRLRSTSTGCLPSAQGEGRRLDGADFDELGRRTGGVKVAMP
jgi:hypothetical protein